MSRKLLFLPSLLWHSMMRLFLRLYHRLSFDGLSHLPKDQSFILVSNHTSHLDAPCLVAALPLKHIKDTTVAAARDCFFKTVWHSILFRFLINATPFDRLHNPAQSLLSCSRKVTGKQKILVFFPEGTRSLTGLMQRFKSGIGTLVAGKKVLIVPAYIEGAYEAWPKVRWLPLPYRVRVTVGKPMAFAHIPRTKEGFELIAKAVEQEIRLIKESL